MKIKFKDPNKIPQKYPKVVRQDPTMDDPGFVEVGGYRLRPNVDLIPQRGMQEELSHSDCNLIFLTGSATGGKMQPYDADIITPSGIRKMGDLQVGDIISSVDGNTQTVEEIYEHGMQDVYEVTFTDGRTTQCGLEHLWKASRRNYHNGFKEYETLTLAEIKKFLEEDDRNKVAIPYCSPIEFYTHEELPIKPYTLGALLGDGSLTQNCNPWITTIDVEILENIKSEGYHYWKPACRTKEYKVSGDDILLKIKELGLYQKRSWEKFIPKQYKFASISDRIKLLQGLIDTDGCVAKNSYKIQYTTTSPQLRDDILWIARSLGFRVTYSTTIPSYTYKGEKKRGREAYIMRIVGPHMQDIIKLKRKRDLCAKTYAKGRDLFCCKIETIKYIGKKQCRCIRVSSPDRLYLTDDFIVTHNTFGGLLASMKGIGKQNYTGRIITMQSKDGEGGTSMARDAEQIYGSFAGCKLSKSGGITAEWPQWNNAIKFIHVNFNPDNPKEWNDFKQHAKANTAIFMYGDEASGIETWKKFAYLFSRNRDSSGAMRPKMIISFNPEHEHWTTAFLKRAGYLTEDWWFNKAMSGKTIYFFSTGDDVDGVVFGKTRKEVVEKACVTVSDEEAALGMTPEDMVKSFTCLFASPADNKILVNITKGESIANLAAVGKTEGAKMHLGYFGPTDSGMTKVTPKVIENIFTSPVSDFKEARYATLDVSAGGDLTIMWIWRGTTLIGREDIVSDDPVKLEQWVSHCLNKWGVPMRNFAYDSGGMGFFLKRYKDGFAVTNNMRPVQEIDSFGNATDIHKDYYDIRSQLMAKFEAMLIMGDISCEISPQTMYPHTKKKILTPFINILMEERNLFIWEKINNKTKARTKNDFKTRYGYSPDAMDSLWLIARFHIDSRPKKEDVIEFTEADYYTAFNNW